MKPEPIKREDLRPCAICQRGLMHNHVASFFRINIETCIANLPAIQRLAGLEMMMGGGQAGAHLANVLSPNENLAEIMDTSPALICFDCADEHGLLKLKSKLSETNPAYAVVPVQTSRR